MEDADGASSTRLRWLRSHLTVAVVTALTVGTAMAAFTSSTSVLGRQATTPGLDATLLGAGVPLQENNFGTRSAGNAQCDRHSLRLRDTTLSPGITYLYLAGVEGSGHHALMSVFDALLNDEEVAGGYTSGDADGALVSIVPRREAMPVNRAGWALWRNDDAAKHIELLDAFITALRVVGEDAATASIAANSGGGGGRHILFGPFSAAGEPLSYPFGELRNAVSRPVFADVSQGCASVGIAVKMIVLHRDPIAATYSRIHQQRRELGGHALLQARIVMDNLRAVAKEMGALRCDEKVTIRYEKLLDDPTSYASALHAFTGIPLAAAEKALTTVTGSLAHDFSSALSSVEIASLERYFGYENGALPDKAAIEGGFWPLVDPSLDITEWAKRRRRRRL